MQDREAGLFDWSKTLECTADEGVNVIRFDWVGNQHGAVKNTDHWMMSCFGLGNKCSEECEGTLLDWKPDFEFCPYFLKEEQKRITQAFF